MGWGGRDTARVVAPPPLLYLAAWLAAVLADLLLRLDGLGMRAAPRLLLAAVLFTAGAALGLWALALMKRAGTNVIPDRPTTALVTSGPFRWSRNPGYLCQTLIYLALVVAADSHSGLVLLAPLLVLVHYGVVKREERYLERLFGDEYRAYRRRVRRWV